MKQGTLVNPEGVFYMTSNSATGSKFYNLIEQQQDYVAARSHMMLKQAHQSMKLIALLRDNK